MNSIGYVAAVANAPIANDKPTVYPTPVS